MYKLQECSENRDETGIYLVQINLHANGSTPCIYPFFIKALTTIVSLIEWAWQHPLELHIEVKY